MTTGFLLIHGAGHDHRCWEPLIAHLDAPSLAIDLPGRGLTESDSAPSTITALVESAVTALDSFTETEQVVLVGHSMAGLTVPGVAAARPSRVAQLVFLSCFIPAEGHSVMDELPAIMRAVNRSPLGVRAGGRMSPRAARFAYCNGMTAEQKEFTASRIVPEDVSRIVEERVSRTRLPPATVIPRTYVKLLRDRALRPRMQDRFIANLGNAQIRTIETCHDAMISRPAELATILAETRRASD